MPITARTTAAGAGLYAGDQFTAIPEAFLEVYSAEIIYTAQAIMRFREFATEKTELEKQAGDTIQFTQYDNIELGGRLNENESLGEKTMAASRFSITVTEWGNAIAVSEKTLQTSWDDQLQNAAILLGRDYAKVNDLMCRDALLAASSEIYGGGKAGIINLVAADVFDTETIRVAVEILQTANAAKFNGDFYICFIHPHQAAYLKRDNDWVAANNYANTRALFNGELGRWEDVIFISTTHMPNGAAPTTDVAYDAALDGDLGGVTGDNSDAYRAVFFADGAFGVATALPVEMRDGGVFDYGRKHGIAWYSIEEGGNLIDENIVLAVTT